MHLHDPTERIERQEGKDRRKKSRAMVIP